MKMILDTITGFPGDVKEMLGDIGDYKTVYFTVLGLTFLAGHIVQSKFNTLGKIEDAVEGLPAVGKPLADIIEKLQ